jgi:hypothetical protein
LLSVAALRAAHAQTPDSTIDGASRLVRRAMTAVKDTPLVLSTDAGQIITALRSSNDVGLLPVFDRLRESKSVDNQVYAMVAEAVMTKDAKRVDVPLLLSSKDQKLIGSAVASLIDAELLGPPQLEKIVADAAESAHRVMAVGELARQQALKDRGVLKTLLNDPQEGTRYLAAVTMLKGGAAEEVAAALAALKALSAKHDLKQAPMQALMLVELQKSNTTAALPWAAAVAADGEADEGLRYTAVAAVLTLKGPEGPRLLADMIDKQRDTIQQVKLGLIALEYADQLKPAMLEPLVKARSALAKTIGGLAQKAAEGGDITAGLLALLKEGHPIVLDWALAYSDRTDADRRLTLRTALVNQSTIVDNIRDRDYNRAVLAAQKLLDGDGAAGRKTVVNLLKSDNRAVVEASLGGIYRSKVDNQAELVMPVWEGLTRSTSTETAASFAALILAREGRKEALTWLPGMVAGGTVQGPGFRALAGWYYAKLLGQADVMLRSALTE